MAARTGNAALAAATFRNTGSSCAIHRACAYAARDPRGRVAPCGLRRGLGRRVPPRRTGQQPSGRSTRRSSVLSSGRSWAPVLPSPRRPSRRRTTAPGADDGDGGAATRAPPGQDSGGAIAAERLDDEALDLERRERGKHGGAPLPRREDELVDRRPAVRDVFGE